MHTTSGNGKSFLIITFFRSITIYSIFKDARYKQRSSSCVTLKRTNRISEYGIFFSYTEPRVCLGEYPQARIKKKVCAVVNIFWRTATEKAAADALVLQTSIPGGSPLKVGCARGEVRGRRRGRGPGGATRSVPAGQRPARDRTAPSNTCRPLQCIYGSSD